ncbi:MAG: hypothetical protein K2X81_28295 [Candidatus Obscuribacterales bacterium]|nr:hypothetical protein [Candidatus Obscuribacterales bacterium]
MNKNSLASAATAASLILYVQVPGTGEKQDFQLEIAQSLPVLCPKGLSTQSYLFGRICPSQTQNLTNMTNYPSPSSTLGLSADVKEISGGVKSRAERVREVIKRSNEILLQAEEARALLAMSYQEELEDT